MYQTILYTLTHTMLYVNYNSIKLEKSLLLDKGRNPQSDTNITHTHIYIYTHTYMRCIFIPQDL